MSNPQKTSAFTPGVVFQPAVGQGFKRGIDALVAAIRPTLGPLPRTVVLPRATIGSPEILDNGALIARRVLQLPDRDADAGAMFLRQLLWRQHEREGDGTATAAVLFQAVFDGGLAYIAAGGNAMRLRHGLEVAARLVADALARQATPAEGQAMLRRVALSVCGEAGLADRLGEIFDIIGEYGRLEVRTERGRDLEREYVEGIYWEGGVLSWLLVDDQPKARIDLENPAIFNSDLAFDEPDDLVPVLRAAAEAGHQALVIVADRIAERAMSLLLANRRAGAMNIVAVKRPGRLQTEAAAALEDLAYLVGGRYFPEAARSDLARLTAADFGRARTAWANRDYFGIVAGRGDPRALRGHIADLRAAYARAADPDDRKRLRERIGKLLGGSATLWLAAATESEAKFRQALAERTAEAVRGALLEGVVPGGGAAFLACREPLAERLAAEADPDIRAALRIVAAALAQPLRVLARNAGYEPAEVFARLSGAGAGHGFDVLTGRVVDMAAAGVLDPASVQRAAAWRAITGAGLALTTDVLVHHRNPVQEYNP